MKTYLTSFLSNIRDKKFMFVLVLTMTVGALAGFSMNKTKAPLVESNENEAVLLSRLNDLQSQIARLESSANRPLPEVNLSGLESQLNALAEQVKVMKSDHAQNISEQLSKSLNETEHHLGEKLSSIESVISHLDKKTPGIVYVAPEQLPFKVVSIDSIQQTPVASISYDYKTVPMEKGDKIAGWKVVAIHYGQQRIELENNKKEHVLLTEEHIG